jgi:hypothetical protein
MYSFIIPAVIALWSLSNGKAGLIGTVTLLISSLGGWERRTMAACFGGWALLTVVHRCGRRKAANKCPNPSAGRSRRFC